jgi:hypothetical protein
VGSNVAQSFALNSIDLATQVWCRLLFFFRSYRVNFGEASIWRCFGLDPHDSFHLDNVFRIHFIISKEILKDLTSGLRSYESSAFLSGGKSVSNALAIPFWLGNGLLLSNTSPYRLEPNPLV